MALKRSASGMETRDVAPLSIRGAFEASTVDREARTVEVTFSTGAKVLRQSWADGTFWEELSLDPAHVRMGRLNNGAPFLPDHTQSVRTQAGVVESAQLTRDGGRAKVRFVKAGVDPEADRLFEKIADGIVQNISVGYRTWKAEKIEAADNQIPTLRAIDWEPHEISAVAIGADDGAGIRSAEATNPCVFVTRNAAQEQRTMETEVEKAARLAREQAAADAQRAQFEQAARVEGARLERERMAGIQSAVRAAKLPDTVAAELIGQDGMTLDKARAVVLERLASASDAMQSEQHIRAEITDDAQDKTVRALSAALILRAGADAVSAVRRLDSKLELEPGKFRGMSLMDIVKETLERAGVNTRHMTREQMVGKAFTHRSSGMSSTSDFPVLFENVMHKVLLGMYATQPSTWQEFCKQSTVRDFRPSNRYRNGSFGVLSEVPEGGEYQNVAIPDGEKTSISIQTYGKMVAITRQAIINDDMGALTDLVSRFATMAGRSIEVEVYRQLLLNSGFGPDQDDTNPFFDDTARSNVGTESELSVAGLDADRVLMASRLDKDGNDYLDLRPAILLVPLGMESAAKVINESAFNPTDGSGLQAPNPARGMFRKIVASPRLSGTKRYLFADPAVAAAVEVAFLEGVGNAPQLESEQGWRVDGTEWKLRLDYGVKFMDYRAAILNEGDPSP